MVSNLNKRIFLRILINLKQENVNLYTQKQISKLLKVSPKKVNSFMNGKIYDFWMLTQFAGLLGMNITFNLE